MTIETLNVLRSWWSRQGEPGDAPEVICPGCGFEGDCHSDEGECMNSWARAQMRAVLEEGKTRRDLDD